MRTESLIIIHIQNMHRICQQQHLSRHEKLPHLNIQFITDIHYELIQQLYKSVI